MYNDKDSKSIFGAYRLILEQSPLEKAKQDRVKHLQDVIANDPKLTPQQKAEYLKKLGGDVSQIPNEPSNELSDQTYPPGTLLPKQPFNILPKGVKLVPEPPVEDNNVDNSMDGEVWDPGTPEEIFDSPEYKEFIQRISNDPKTTKEQKDQYIQQINKAIENGGYIEKYFTQDKTGKVTDYGFTVKQSVNYDASGNRIVPNREKSDEIPLRRDPPPARSVEILSTFNEIAQKRARMFKEIYGIDQIQKTKAPDKKFGLEYFTYTIKPQDIDQTGEELRLKLGLNYSNFSRMLAFNNQNWQAYGNKPWLRSGQVINVPVALSYWANPSKENENKNEGRTMSGR